MAFDDIFEVMSGAGWYQVTIYMLLGLPSFYGGVQSIIMSFLGPDQEHWCYVPRLQEYCHDVQRHVAIPLTDDGEYDRCHYYDLPYDNLTDEQIANWNRSYTDNTATIPCESWYYDQTEYYRTIVSDYDLVCDKSWLVQMAYSVNLAAKLIMGVVGGILADKYGRKPLMVVGACTSIFFVFGSAYAQTYGGFILGRTLLFCTVVLTYATGFILPIEIFAPEKRFIPGGFYWIYWSIGFMTVPAMAYFVRDSVKLQLAAGVPMILQIAYVWLVPESPRWELTQGKQEKCNQTLRFIAEVNQDEVPDKVYESLEPDQQNSESQESFWSLVKLAFGSRTLRRRFLLTLPAWAGCNIVYYGLSYNTGALSGNLYVNTAMSGFVEIPANLLTLYLLTKAGRKYTLAIFLILAGLANFICIPFIYTSDELDWLLVTFSMLGKACITVAFTTLCFFALELFPTSVRALMYNASALIGGSFSLIAPFMGPPLISIWKPLPLIIFGALGVVSGALVFLLPDTSKADLPDTILDAEELGTEKERRREAEVDDSKTKDNESGYGSVRHRGAHNAAYEDDETGSDMNLTKTASSVQTPDCSRM